ncbi:cobaltochelatase subunit CobN [Rhizobium sp. CFBP 8762]|uniref:cobaltochelatase subunit CobN n=1 Tax=Rhizobium sp. CFBP 8762 TaxID=2775279 RepID=UPI0017870ED0|nr:cobaltochelatase subunit CobN [Rhizobium sp. CFBP 8762]MBD8554739.1 cobaltochelatase subunit CobN [Rhizobium sp. CFBP 8762]
MHLLLAQKGTIADGSEAIDLGQSPGDILFLSAADTELSSIAAAQHGRFGSRLRVASLMTLSHPLSVDTYVERTVRHAKLVVVRPLGGTSYFQYLLEAFYAAAITHGFQIAILPGCDKPDPGLDDYSTVDARARADLWAYFTEGGSDNAVRFLDYCDALISGAEKPEPARPLMKGGIWWPGVGTIGTDAWLSRKQPGKPVAALCFYRALVQSGETKPVEALIAALEAEGLNVLPVFVASLKDTVSVAILQSVFDQIPPTVVLNATGFAVSAPGADRKPTVLEQSDATVLQVIFSGSTRPVWEASPQGLMARDLAMNVALPEVDGRVLTRAVSFKAAARFDPVVEANIISHEPVADRVAFTAKLAANWAKLRVTPPQGRRIAIIMANYPNRDGRLGNGVGLDTPAGTVEVLKAMAEVGYDVTDIPLNGDALMAHLMAGPTNAADDARVMRETISCQDYKRFFAALPKQIQSAVTERWGEPETDPYVQGDVFALPLARFGGVMLGIQPARGYQIDAKESYHSPDLVPPHGYFAFYAFLRQHFCAHAIVHMGKHGNLEWLPGKALALSENCYPEAIFGPMPHLYPFIVNDPGEGTQAKRRTSAVIIDHLTPPLTRAETYGPLKDLEALVDEYYDASGGDPRRLRLLQKQILDLVRDIGLDQDAGITPTDAEDTALQKLDAYLCDLKEMQIRDGLHIFGLAPEGRLLTDLTVALARVPRGQGEGGDASLHRAIAADCNLAFDPLNCGPSDVWDGPRPEILAAVDPSPWRSHGDTVERIELLAASFVSGAQEVPGDWAATKAVMDMVNTHLRPSITQSGAGEIAGLLAGLDGRFVAPGPSGAPTRGRPDVLPTGRNFYSVDSRAVPTPTAYQMGKASAELMIRRYVQDNGDWPTSFALTAWGTSNMRTGGDDIAQAMALIGTKPIWDMMSRRVTGYEIVPLAILGRPRVDVTLRISGFFRDAFPDQIALFDKAIRAVGALDEEAGDNMIAARMRAETEILVSDGMSQAVAARRASWRIFGSKPGAYGAGLQALMDDGGWQDRGDLAEAYLVWGSYAYGAGEDGTASRGVFEHRLQSVEAVVQNQDNREHDLLDSDDYYQFQGGMSAAVERLTGVRPVLYHNDHSRPEKPVIRTLDEEIARVVRARVVNPKWIAGVMRHGYKGGFEIAATVDFMFAFAATTGAVRNHHFDAAYEAFIGNAAVRAFLADKNPAALREMSAKFEDAIARGLWKPRSNSAAFELASLKHVSQKWSPVLGQRHA